MHLATSSVQTHPKTQTRPRKPLVQPELNIIVDELTHLLYLEKSPSHDHTDWFALILHIILTVFVFSLVPNNVVEESPLQISVVTPEILIIETKTSMKQNQEPEHSCSELFCTLSITMLQQSD